MTKSFGAVIVPCVLNDVESITNLNATISEVPENLNWQVVAVIQGDAQIRQLCLHNRASRNHTIVEAEPIGKWPAIWLGLNHVNAEAQWIAVFDGDAAFSAQGLSAVISPVANNNAQHVVGQRDIPMLSSVDDLSSNTRIFIEAYFNTLVLLSLGQPCLTRYRGFDIQCGLQGFESSWLRTLARTPMPLYRGEALLFHKSIEAGVAVAPATVTQRMKSQSSYRTHQIVAELLGLDFVAGISTETFESAVEAAANTYDKWILDRIAFRFEIEELVLRLVRSR